MFRIVKRIVRDQMLKKGYRISRSKSKQAIIDLIKKLQPKDVGLSLVRIGPDSDGGYLVPDDLSGLHACFSPGVSNISGFEDHIASRGIPCFMADFSVEGPATDNKLFTFTKKYLGNMNNDMFMTMEKWVEDSISGEDGDLLLQMDIEGGEYLVFNNIDLSLLKRFRIMVIEFHYVDAILDPVGSVLLNEVFDKILTIFNVVHVHPNNCDIPINFDGVKIPPTIEMTFIRKDRCRYVSNVTVLPHPLDRDNVRGKSIYLQDIWFK